MIILLAGKMGSGKDFIADYLVENNFIKYGVADGIKATFKQLVGVPPNKKIQDHRELLQLMGNEMREQDKNYWVDMLCNNLKTDGRDIVISDIRFQHEIDTIKERYKNVISVKLKCHKGTRKKRLKERDGILPTNMDDISELSVDKIKADLVIDTSKEGISPEIAKIVNK